MEENKSKALRINFCLKENQEPRNSLSSMDNKVDLSAAKRLFDAEEKFRASVQEKTAKFTESDFDKIYQTLDEAERPLYRMWHIDVKEDQNVEELLEEIKNHPNVEFADVDELNVLYFNPNDPLYDKLYGLDKIDSPHAWDTSQGEGVVVAVLDTGVNYNHPDIKNNMWKDQNGKFGYDFSDNDSDPIDYHGHGTHVAGTIAATGNNNTGIIGVAPKAKIMAVKIFPNATDSVIARALKYAVDNGAKVLNNSWGPQGRRASAPVLEAAVNYVHSKGGICVFAAGNANDDAQFYSPANMNTTITVGASDSNDNRASFSNFGNKVDVAAPGVDILSLKHNDTGYTKKSGTSMASPHVAGAVALLLSKKTSLDFEEVRDRLKNTSDPISTDKSIGEGRINTYALLNDVLSGDYTIQQKSNNRFLDAHESSGNDFSAVTRTAQNNNTQRWKFTQVGTVCTIQQKSNNRFLDAHASSNNDFSAVTRTAQNNNTQRWVFMHSPENLSTYTIQQLVNGRFLDAYGSSGKDFSAVTRTAQNNDTQKWILAPLGADTYTIQQKHNDRFLDAHTSSGNDFSAVTRTAQNNNTQRWILKPVGKVYTIQQKSNGRFLDAHTSSGKDFSAVTRTAQNNNTQYWVVMAESQGYTIQQLHNARFLDAHQSSSKDFSAVTRTTQNNNTQRWLIKPV